MQSNDGRPILPVFDAGPLLEGLRLQTEQLTTSISQFVGRLADEQLSQVQEVVGLLADQGARQIEVVDLALRSLGRAMERTLSEAQIASKDIAGPLKEAGFWVPPSAPMSLIVQLSSLVRRGPPDTDEVKRLMKEFYGAGEASRLRMMVSDWRRHPALAQLQAVIDDALEAHAAGKYTLSIPALLPIVERLLTDLHGGYIRGKKMPTVASQQIGGSYTDFMREASKDAVLHFITGTGLYGTVPREHFTVSGFPTWLASEGLTERDVVNRHAIVHGVQVDYAGESNSLRVFLLIDVLCWLTREEWDERLKIILKRHGRGNG